MVDPNISERIVSVWAERLDMTVQVAGNGPPLVYLHGAGGMVWDQFVKALAADYTVYAPLVPGTAPGNKEAIAEVADLWALVLVYEETIKALNLDQPTIVGQSFGGMLGCELAAHNPSLCSRLVILAPIGLWLDEHPVTNWIATAPDRLPALLLHDPDGEVGRAMFTPPDDPDVAIAMVVGMVWAMGCTSKFVWPVPDKGLATRIHRIVSPTLVVWGRQDALVSVAYAAEFGRLIAGSRVEIFDECGHIPQLEQFAKTLAVVTEFLGAD